MLKKSKISGSHLLRGQRNLSALIREIRFEHQLTRSEFRRKTGLTEMNVKSLESRAEVSAWSRSAFKIKALSDICDMEASDLLEKIIGHRGRSAPKARPVALADWQLTLLGYFKNLNGKNRKILSEIFSWPQERISNFLSLLKSLMQLDRSQIALITSLVEAFDKSNKGEP